jgi:AraC-like DNA-binding protein
LDHVESVLESLKLQSSVFCRMELMGNWAFAKDALPGAPFHIVISGEAWLRLPAQVEPTRLLPGDVVILPGGDAHELTSAPGLKLIPFKAVLAQLGLEPWSSGMTLRSVPLKYGSGIGDGTRLISGVFGFGDRRKNPLLSALPPLFHVRATDAKEASPGACFPSTVALLAAEVGSGRPGSGTVAGRLADILFIQAVRFHLASGASADPGWLRGITDPQIGRALARIHSQPDRPWLVASLAKEAGMSRSRFAMRFQEIVGQSPLDYLTQWRMYEAAGQLAEGKIGLAILATRAGYKSEIAFSKAFKRCVGHSPAEFRRRLSSTG